MEYFEVITNAVTGEKTIRPYTPEEITERKKAEDAFFWSSLRSRRNELLTESDSQVLPDRWASMSDSKKAEWSAYRQALRDLPQNTADPANPVWPISP